MRDQRVLLHFGGVTWDAGVRGEGDSWCHRPGDGVMPRCCWRAGAALGCAQLGVLGGSAGSPGAAEGVAGSSAAPGWEETGRWNRVGSGSSGGRSRRRLAAPRREIRDCRSCRDSPSALARLLFGEGFPRPEDLPSTPCAPRGSPCPRPRPPGAQKTGCPAGSGAFPAARLQPGRTLRPLSHRPPPALPGSRPWIPGE